MADNIRNRSEDVAALDGETAIAAGTRASVNLSSNKVESTSGTNKVPTSFAPSGTSVGSAVRERIVDDSGRGAETAIKAEKKQRTIQSVPTADLITHSSFKKDQKMVIRMVQSPTLGLNKDDQSQLNEDKSEYVWDKFSLQGVAENDNERYQLHETFDAETLFLFGRSPRIWTYSGIVLNGKRPRIPASLQGDDQSTRILREQFLTRYNMDFANEMSRRYDQYYRGTKAVERRTRAYLVYDDVIVEGTIVNLVLVRNSNLPGAANVTFTVVVHQRAFVGSSLLDIEEQTLTKLIQDQVRDVQVSNLLPDAIIPPNRNFNQVLADFNETQAELATLQGTVGNLTADQEAALGAIAEEESEQLSLLESRNEILADIAQAGTPEEEAEARRLLAENDMFLETSRSRVQQLQSIEENVTSDLASATAEQETKIQEQELKAEEVDKASNAVQNACPDGYVEGQIIIFTDFVINEEESPRLRLQHSVKDASTFADALTETGAGSTLLGAETKQEMFDKTFDYGISFRTPEAFNRPFSREVLTIGCIPENQ